jgi:hypothetical protein
MSVLRSEVISSADSGARCRDSQTQRLTENLGHAGTTSNSYWRDFRGPQVPPGLSCAGCEPVNAKGDPNHQIRIPDCVFAACRRQCRPQPALCQVAGNVVELVVGTATNSRNCCQADNDNQSQHDRVFNSGWAVFRNDELLNAVRELFHLEHPSR